MIREAEALQRIIEANNDRWNCLQAQPGLRMTVEQMRQLAQDVDKLLDGKEVDLSQYPGFLGHNAPDPHARALLERADVKYHGGELPFADEQLRKEEDDKRHWRDARHNDSRKRPEIPQQRADGNKDKGGGRGR